MSHKSNQSDAMARQEVNNPLIISVGIISVLLLVVIAIGAEAWFRYEEEAEVADKWALSQNTWLMDIRHKQIDNLSRSGWADKDKKAAMMPISQAMKIVAENGGKTPQATAR